MNMNLHDFWQRYQAGDRNFPGVNLAGETFEYEEIDAINLSNANLEAADICSFILLNSNLSGVNFRGASFYETSFIYCNLSGANFAEVTADLLTFDQCDLTNATITDPNDEYFNQCVF